MLRFGCIRPKPNPATMIPSQIELLSLYIIASSAARIPVLNLNSSDEISVYMTVKPRGTVLSPLLTMLIMVKIMSNIYIEPVIVAEQNS